MSSRNERAAAMRQTWLGDAAGEAVAWNELKQLVRDRWLAALDAAQPEVPHGVPSVDPDLWKTPLELKDVDGDSISFSKANKHSVHIETHTAYGVCMPPADAARMAAWLSSYAAAHGASVEATTQPLSDEIIERMAEACCNGLYQRDMWSDSPCRDYWRNAIRAALAAVGPQYCPADVAFGSRVPELESKIDNQRMTLRQLHNLREKERAERNILERELDEARAERDGLKKRNDVQAEQLIRIDSEISPLMSEVAELKAELAELKAQPGGWELDVPENGWLADGFCIYNPSTGEGHSLESFVSHVCSRIRPVAPRAELAGVEAELESLKRALVEAKQQRDIVASKLITHGVSARDLYAQGDGKPFGGWHSEDGYKIASNDELVKNAYKLAAQPEGAALAAVGPQYCPADVAFGSRVPELERELAEARAELAAAEIELADLRFYQREFAAVSAERDGLKKRNEIQAEQLIRIDREISPLMSEVAELKAERDAARAELAEARAALEAELAAEVAENVRLRTREVGDEVGNLLQEVADLKNELARVKAESLRVVKDGEAISAGEVGYSRPFTCEHRGVWMQFGATYGPDGCCGIDVINVNARHDTQLLATTLVQPVRIERWEDEG